MTKQDPKNGRVPKGPCTEGGGLGVGLQEFHGGLGNAKPVLDEVAKVRTFLGRSHVGFVY